MSTYDCALGVDFFSPGPFAQGQFKKINYFKSTSALQKSWSIDANSVSISTVNLILFQAS